MKEFEFRGERYYAVPQKGFYAKREPNVCEHCAINKLDSDGTCQQILDHAHLVCNSNFATAVVFIDASPDALDELRTKQVLARLGS